MSDPNKQNQSPEEEYANAYFYFLKTLETLSESAVRQCEIMDYFNVPWELRDDANKRANAILNLPGGRLSNEQRNKIQHFLAALGALPDSVVDIDNTKEENLRAMNSPFWSSLRVEAQKLTKLLQPETERTNAILWPTVSDQPSRNPDIQSS